MTKAGVPSQSKPEDFVVVITATITPAEGVKIVRADPELRKRDYLEGLTFWLEQRDPRLQRILFLENSGAPLDDFAALAAKFDKAVELMAVPTGLTPPSRQYGFAEMRTIEYALGHSQLLKEARFLIKATGRLKFPGISKLLDRLPPDLEIAVDSRNRGRMFGMSRGFTPTQLFIVAKDFYVQHFATSYDRMTEQYYLELLIYDELNAMPRSKRRVLRWPVSVEPVGFAAHANKQYDSGGRLAVITLRKVLRVIVPSFWF